jgi:hypothetical protein
MESITRKVLPYLLNPADPMQQALEYRILISIRLYLQSVQEHMRSYVLA